MAILNAHFAQRVIVAHPQEGEWISTIQSTSASLKEKSDACRMLARYGGKNAVEPLAELLGEPKLSHMARYALEPCPYPRVDETFRKALGKLKGRELVGVIGSIGVRRDTQAVSALSQFLLNDDAEVAQAAARALGSIGSSEVIRTFINVKPNAPKAVHPHIYEGWLRCAERLEEQGYSGEALYAYDQLQKMQAPPHIRAAALRGAVLLRNNDGISLVMETLKHDNDFALVQASMRIAQELPGSKVSKVLAGELNNLPQPRQILVIQTLGYRGDEEALAVLDHLASRGQRRLRLEAVRALGDLGRRQAVPTLKRLSYDTDDEIAQAAKAGLLALTR